MGYEAHHSKEPRGKEAVIRVGDGRGFIVESGHDRFVITAAHCLPHFPPCHGASYTEERTYANLLGKLDEEPTVWTECLFADPISDLAVLGCPDNQELSDEADAYERLTEVTPVLPIGTVEGPAKPPDWSDLDALRERQTQVAAGTAAWLLSLDHRWVRCIAVGERRFWIKDAADGIRGGMSGSPIVDEGGSAIGIVSVSGGGVEGIHTEGGPNARLDQDLPRWVDIPTS